MSDTNGIFEKVDPGVKLYRSRFPRRFQKLIDAYPGRLYPILADVMMPGDIVKLGLRWNIKANPSVTPYFTRVRGSVFYFVVPFRMIYGTEYGDKSDTFFQDIVTGGKDGNNADSLPLLTKPEFFQDLGPIGTKIYSTPVDSDGNLGTPDFLRDVDYKYARSPYLCSLSNCFGYETWTYRGSTPPVVPASVKYAPTQSYHRAYWRIVTDYFIDEDTQGSGVDFRFKGLSSWFGISGTFGDSVETGYPFRTLWSRDYFMSALKDFLKGSPPALDVGSFSVPSVGLAQGFARVYGAYPNTTDLRAVGVGSDSNVKGDSPGSFVPGGSVNPNPLYADLRAVSTNPVSGSISGAFGVDEMRLAFATQRILERANRCGTRYTEYLLSTFRTSPSDGTLQRPWYIGGVRFDIVTPEVLQTSESSSTPQGTRVGAGFSVGGSRAGTYHAKEWSVLMAVLNIEPDATYMQGMPRQSRYMSRWDFFNPSMQNLSEQVVSKGEIFADVLNSLPSYNPSDGFGYQGMWNELRTKMDEVSGNFRYSELDNWHMALTFKAVPALSVNFKQIVSYQDQIMRPFAVRTMPPFLCSFYHDNIWIRPMVRHPVPGLIDHN